MEKFLNNNSAVLEKKEINHASFIEQKEREKASLLKEIEVLQELIEKRKKAKLELEIAKAEIEKRNRVKIEKAKLEERNPEQEKLYLNKNFYLSKKEVSEIENLIEDVKKQNDELLSEKNKSIFARDGEKIKKLTSKLKEIGVDVRSKDGMNFFLKKQEEILKPKKEFLDKQENFLSKHPSVDLEGKTNEEIVNLLLKDPQLVHFMTHPIAGNGVKKIISGDYVSKHGWSDNENSYGLSIVNGELKDLRATTEEQRRKIFGPNGINRNANYQARPVVYKTKAGESYGIVFPMLDGVERPGYGSFFTVFSSPGDKKIKDYIKQNPEILIEMLKHKEFFDTLDYFNHAEKEKGQNIRLASNEFVDIDQILSKR